MLCCRIDARRPFLQTRFNDRQAMFSPDGRWVAYTSDESGHDEVYVRPFPGPGSRTAVSVGGGSDPRWRRDGRELFYRNGDTLMSSDMTLGAHFSSAPAAACAPNDQFAPYRVSASTTTSTRTAGEFLA